MRQLAHVGEQMMRGNTKATTDRMAETQDVQIASAYFVHDVQSAGVRDWTTQPYSPKQSIELGVPLNGGLYGCGLETTPVLVRFAWDDPAVGPPTVRSASYVVKEVDGERQLRRVTRPVAITAGWPFDSSTSSPQRAQPYRRRRSACRASAAPRGRPVWLRC